MITIITKDIITNPNPKVVKDHAKCMLHMLLLTNEIPNLELKLSIACASFYVLLGIKRISTSSLSSFRQGGAEQAGRVDGCKKPEEQK